MWAICRIAGAKGEDAEGAAELGLAEGGGFAFAEGAEFAGTAFDGGARDFIWECGGLGAGAFGERENVEIGEGEAFDKGESGHVVGFGFAGEAGDDVGADGGVGKAFVDEFDAAGVVLGAIPAVHGGEDAVGSGLQRHVEVLGDAIGPGEEIDEVLGYIKWLDGADAEALDGGFAEDASEKVFEFDARRKVAAVGAEVDAAENDFAIAGFGEALNFLDDRTRRQAAALAAYKGDDTIGAARIAAVLDFESGAGVMAFAAEDGRGKEFGAVEDVAGEDLAEMGPSMLRPYKRMIRSNRVSSKCCGGEKIVRGVSGCGGRDAGEILD